MNKSEPILLLFYFMFVFFHRTDALLCYHCSDSTDDDDIADCIHNIDGLRENRVNFEKELIEVVDDEEFRSTVPDYPYNSRLRYYPYIKNCSDYAKNGVEKYEYCVIEEVQSYGTVNAFIRDCSDMVNFSPVNITSLKFLKADNQTVCGYSHLQYATMCVRVCTGDFCNGPEGSAFRVLASPLASLLMTFMTFLCKMV